jgi:hypothetical protein
MAAVFSVLAADHAEVKAMLAELESGPSKITGASKQQLDLRKRMTHALIIEESWHEAVEEMFFWPAVREHHPAGNTLADEAIAQEQQAKHVLAELDKLEADDVRFEVLLGTFIRAAREHIDFEETQVWPGLHAVLPAGAAEELGRDITHGKNAVLTPAPAHVPVARRAQGGRPGQPRPVRRLRRLRQPANRGDAVTTGRLAAAWTVMPLPVRHDCYFRTGSGPICPGRYPRSGDERTTSARRYSIWSQACMVAPHRLPRVLTGRRSPGTAPARTAADRPGASLHAVCARPQTRRLLWMTGVDRRTPLAATVDGALMFLGASRAAPS